MSDERRSFIDPVMRVLEWLVIVTMVILVVAVVWQVATRYLLGHPSSWTEELATLLLVWVSLLGATLGFHRNRHLGVELLNDRLSPEKSAILAIGVQASIIVFAVFALIYGGGRLVYLTWITKQHTPALGIPRGIVYSVLPFSGCIIVLVAVEQVMKRIRELRRLSKNH